MRVCATVHHRGSAHAAQRNFSVCQQAGPGATGSRAAPLLSALLFINIKIVVGMESTVTHHPLHLCRLQAGALTTAQVCEALGLQELANRKWHVQGSIAIKGEGLYEGLDWLAGALKSLQRSGVTTSVNAVGR